MRAQIWRALEAAAQRRSGKKADTLFRVDPVFLPYRRLLLPCLLVAVMPPAAGAGVTWKSITPREAGLDASALAAWKNALANSGTSGLLVVRRGAIAYEWYAPDSGVDKPHGTASMAKALVGGMSLAIAIGDGRIAADDPASKYIPAWLADPLKSKISIRQLATHTSGIEDAEQGGLPHDQLPGWKGAFWKRVPDPFQVALRDAPAIFEPGSQYAYSNPGMAALAYAVTASLKGGDIRRLLKDRIFDPLGIPPSDWSIGYGRGYELDGLTLYANWGGASFTARAAALVGQLMMQQGTWNGRELVRRSAFQQVATYAGMPKPPRTTDRFAPASGLAWYTNADGVWPEVPRDAIAGAGAGHQSIVIIPSLELVVVRNGQAMSDRNNEFWTPIYEKVLKPLMAAITERGPYPPSPVIRRLVFLPDIRRTAIDSDNWPITWGDDDDQYTSYGDGWGFDPRTERKLGMGFARIAGPPEEFHGINLRSAGERMGGGAGSPKASGILMVDGVLYLWVRNVGNSQLLWSKDHGRTWESGFRLQTGFGSPTFLNFGRDYGGARDEFVYSYSQDGPSAYESDNQLALARFPSATSRTGRPGNSSRRWTKTAALCGRRTSTSADLFSPTRRTAAVPMWFTTRESGVTSWRWPTMHPETGAFSTPPNPGGRGQWCSIAMPQDPPPARMPGEFPARTVIGCRRNGSVRMVWR